MLCSSEGSGDVPARENAATGPSLRAAEVTLLVGIFIGGGSTRMGRTKGLLAAPPDPRSGPERCAEDPSVPGEDSRNLGEACASASASGSAGSRGRGEGETIVERTFRIVQAALPTASVVLVGDRDEFDGICLERIRDAQPNTGPLGGLVGLLRSAEERGVSHVLALGSDFPYLTESLLTRLATTQSKAAVLAPFLDNRYQPLVARYAVTTLGHFEACLEATSYGLQRPLRELDAAMLELEAADPEALVDWDTPEDVLRGRSGDG